MDENLQQEPVFMDAFFRQRKKHGKLRVVEAPTLEGLVTDSHTHVHLTVAPALNIAKCMVWGVDTLCNVVDIAEDGEEAFDQLDAWFAEAPAIAREIAVEAGRESLATSEVPAAAQDVAEAMPDAATLCAPKLRFIVGCHPHNARLYDAAMEVRVRDALRDPRVCAIGEAGLDFHYDFSPRDAQIDAFRRQIRMAHELDLPLCLHIREAHDIALRILKEEGFPQAGSVLHCFNLGFDVLEPWLAHDVYVGLDGPITFKKCDDLRDAVLNVPAERLLIETDAPFMTPEPMRGMECSPAHVIFVADALARLRGIEGAEARSAFFAQLQANTNRLYGRGPRRWQTGRTLSGPECESIFAGQECEIAVAGQESNDAKSR